jgi:Clp amino terminal domain, pathogenicity island component
VINQQFTDAASRVMALAEQEARALNHGYIGTEHILLGLIQEGSGTVSNLLKTFGVAPSEIRHEIEGLVQRGPNSIAAGTIPLTPRARRVIECASDEVKFMNEASVGPEHLLLGLFREPDGVASRALRNLGLQIGQVVTEVFRIRLEQMKIVERAVRPVPAGTAWKRKTREELLAHLTSIYDEEQERLRDPAAAMREAVKRFGDPTELARELTGALPLSERRSHYLERVFGWRAPETAARFMLRQSMQTFVVLAVVCLVGATGTMFFAGWNGSMWHAARTPITCLLLTPVVQFLLGLFYYKMRDALYGPVWARKSIAWVVIFAALTVAVTFFFGVGAIALSTWDWERVTDSLSPMGAVALAAAVVEFVLARVRGPIEIRDTMWACLNIDGF